MKRIFIALLLLLLTASFAYADGATYKTIEFRRGTAAQWTAANPTPASGEPCYETDTGLLKIGDGATQYNTLPYFSTGGISALTVKYCNAKCDGVTDDRATINACIGVNTAVILPPYKVCNISDEIDITTNSVAIIGEHTTLNLTAANKNHVHVGGQVSVVNAVTVSGLVFTTSAGSASTSGYAVYADFVGAMTVTNNFVYGANKIYGGIRLNRGTYVDINKNRIWSTQGGHGIYATGIDFATQQVGELRVWDNDIESGAGHGILLDSYLNGVFILNNLIFNHDLSCIQILGSNHSGPSAYLTSNIVDVFISNNDINSCSDNLVHIEKASHFKIDNNQFTNARGTAAAVSIDSTSQYGTINNNIAYQSSGSTANNFEIAGQHIDLTSNQAFYGTKAFVLASTAQYIGLRDNTVGNSTTGIDLTAGPSHVAIANNRFVSTTTNISTGGTSITRSDLVAGAGITFTNNTNGTTTVASTSGSSSGASGTVQLGDGSGNFISDAGFTFGSNLLQISESDASSTINVQNITSSADRFPALKITNYINGHYGYPEILTYQSGGTQTSPAALGSGRNLFGLNVNAMGSTGWQNAAQMIFTGAGAFTDANHLTDFHLLLGTTGSNGSLTDRFTVLNTGLVGISNAAPAYALDVTGDVNITTGSHFKINGTNIAPGDVGLSNVTNNAQVKKISSSTNNNFMSWNGTTGDTPADSGYNSSSFLPTLKTEVDGHASGSLTAAQVSGTTINNYGQAASNVVLAAPAAAVGYNFKSIVGTTQGGNTWQVDFGSAIMYFDGSGTAKRYITVTPAIGNYLECFTFKTGASQYSWSCKTGSGSWTAS